MRFVLPFFLASLFSLRAASQKLPGVSTAGNIEQKDTAFTRAVSTLPVPQADPCEVAKAAVEKAVQFSGTDVFKTAMLAIKEKLVTDPAHEHAIAFGRDTYGNPVASSIATGGRSSGYVPAVREAFADLHNHPKNTPPSSGDLYGLLRKNRRDSRYSSRYVSTPGGDLYAFVITDTVAASLFLTEFPPQQMPGYSPLFPDEVLNEFREARYLHGATEEMAMAYILEKYATGVSLLKQDHDGVLRKLRVAVSHVASQLIFTRNDCPYL